MAGYRTVDELMDILEEEVSDFWNYVCLME